MGTSFTKVYSKFLNKITDDMYLELTPEDTYKDLRRLLIEAIPLFEFPRQTLGYTEPAKHGRPQWQEPGEEVQEGQYVPEWQSLDPEEGFEEIGYQEEEEEDTEPIFDNDLTDEEQNILAIIMMCGWLQRQITSIENTRMKYSGLEIIRPPYLGISMKKLGKNLEP